MVEGEPGLRYQGVRRATGGWWRGEEQVRLHRDGRERLRLETLNPEGEPRRIFIRVGDRSWTWSAREPGTWKERGARRTSREPWRHLDLVFRNYRVEDRGREEFLGRACTVLRVSSARAHRPQVQVWVDLEHHLGLKMEKTSPAGEAVLAYEFTELSFPARFDDELFAVPPEPAAQSSGPGEAEPPGAHVGRGSRPRVRRFETLAELVGAVEAPVLVPVKVPVGFVEMEYGQLAPMGAVRIGYTDGLSEISLYQSGPRREGQAPSPGEARTGSQGSGRPPTGRPVGSRGGDPSSGGEGRPHRGGLSGAESRGRRPQESRDRDVGPSGAGDFQAENWEGIELQVGRVRGMVFVRRLVGVEGSAGVRTTVVGEIGEEELKEMSASLVQRRVPAVGSEASDERQSK